MASFALISLVGMLLVEGVQWYLIATTGQSIGKRVLGVQIVRNFDNEPVGFVRGVMIRTWLSWIFFYASMMVLPLVWYVFVLVNFLMLMLAANRRTTLDHLAGTCVIEKGREMMDSIRQRSEQETLAGLGDIEREARGQTSEGGFENPFRE